MCSSIMITLMMVIVIVIATVMMMMVTMCSGITMAIDLQLLLGLTVWWTGLA